MPYNEKKFTSEFNKWLREMKKSIPEEERLHNFWWKSTALEYKLKPADKYLNFKSHFEPQQLPKLFEAKHGCVYKKLSDLDPSLKPFDAFQICYSQAFVVVCWYHKGTKNPKHVYMVDIDDIYREMKTKKSLTEERASDLAQVAINL